MGVFFVSACDIPECQNQAAFRVLGERKPEPTIQHRMCAAHRDAVIDQYRSQLYAITVIELPKSEGAIPKGAAMERHVSNRPAMRCPKVDAFLMEIERVCAKHGMALMPMIETGAFQVIKVKGPGDWKTRDSGEKLMNADVDGETFEKDSDL